MVKNGQLGKDFEGPKPSKKISEQTRQRTDGEQKVWRVGETRMSLTTQRIVTGISSQMNDAWLEDVLCHYVLFINVY